MRAKKMQAASRPAKPFGQWIKSKRREKGIGLWRCAGYAGLGGESLRLIECGRTMPTGCKVRTLYALARVLELDISEVIERAARDDKEFLMCLNKGMECYARDRAD